MVGRRKSQPSAKTRIAIERTERRWAVEDLLVGLYDTWWGVEAFAEAAHVAISRMELDKVAAAKAHCVDFWGCPVTTDTREFVRLVRASYPADINTMAQVTRALDKISRIARIDEIAQGALSALQCVASRARTGLFV